MFTQARLSFLLVPLLAACSATGGGPRDGAAPLDGGSTTTDGGTPFRCTMDSDCGNGFLCAAVSGVPTCVADPNPPPPGDGTDCRPCEAPGECRQGICVQPTSTGAFCEFDDACSAGQLCIAGRCTPDPRVPVPCTTDMDCPTGLHCGASGNCECNFTTDCPTGLACEMGMCSPGDRCVADDECMSSEVCDRGDCRPRTVCEIGHPNFAGQWTMQSILRVRDALPDWIDAFLRAVDGPFRFLSGEATCIDFGLPDWVEMELCDLVRPFVTEFLPPWAPPVFGAIADLNTVLSTWHVEERMTLEAGSLADSYRGTHTWDRITFYHRGMPISGGPTTIPDWRFSPSPFNASAVCGTFHIDRHDVNVSVGGIIAWVVDTLVYELSDHRWSSASAMLAELAGGFCDALGDAAESAIDYTGVGGTVRSVCASALTGLIDGAIQRLIDARVGASPITLRGQAPVTGPDSLRPGTWDGTLLGREFPGDFCAQRAGTTPCVLTP
ncbi:MAG: hypothetical protein IT378_21225 [Sandaracinaceae bacterium]|nr:hypothetical protein [Sandaracinaceae bacterium]